MHSSCSHKTISHSTSLYMIALLYPRHLRQVFYRRTPLKDAAFVEIWHRSQQETNLKDVVSPPRTPSKAICTLGWNHRPKILHADGDVFQGVQLRDEYLHLLSREASSGIFHLLPRASQSRHGHEDNDIPIAPVCVRRKN